MPVGVYKRTKPVWNKGIKTGKKGPHSFKTKEKISLSKLGHSVSKETRRKIGLANKGNLIGDKNPMRRPEIRAKASKIYINRIIKTDYKNYRSVHLWLYKNYGKADSCQNRESKVLKFKCTNISNNFEWANRVNKPYNKNINCFYKLCVPCHKRYDTIYGI